MHKSGKKSYPPTKTHPGFVNGKAVPPTGAKPKFGTPEFFAGLKKAKKRRGK